MVCRLRPNSELDPDNHLQNSCVAKRSRSWLRHRSKPADVDRAVRIAAQSVRCQGRLARRDSVAECKRQVIQRGVQPRKIRVIEHIESVDTELEAHALFNREVLLDRHIEIDDPRRVQIVDAGFEPQASQTRHKEAGWIEAVKRIAGMRVRIASLDDADAGAFGIGAGEILVARSLHREGLE